MSSEAYYINTWAKRGLLKVAYNKPETFANNEDGQAYTRDQLVALGYLSRYNWAIESFYLYRKQALRANTSPHVVQAALYALFIDMYPIIIKHKGEDELKELEKLCTSAHIAELEDGFKRLSLLLYTVGVTKIDKLPSYDPRRADLENEFERSK